MNLAEIGARLESQTKEIKKPIEIDEAACRELNNSLQIEAPDREIFKGKTVPVRVYPVFVTQGINKVH